MTFQFVPFQGATHPNCSFTTGFGGVSEIIPVYGMNYINREEHYSKPQPKKMPKERQLERQNRLNSPPASAYKGTTGCVNTYNGYGKSHGSLGGSGGGSAGGGGGGGGGSPSAKKTNRGPRSSPRSSEPEPQGV